MVIASCRLIATVHIMAREGLTEKVKWKMNKQNRLWYNNSKHTSNESLLHINKINSTKWEIKKWEKDMMRYFTDEGIQIVNEDMKK